VPMNKIESMDSDPEETQEWLDSLASVLEDPRGGAGSVFAAKIVGQTDRARLPITLRDHNALSKYDPSTQRSSYAWGSFCRTKYP
jgi:pyruvate dehydrogenase complex dehydrogenase (E1) component